MSYTRDSFAFFFSLNSFYFSCRIEIARISSIMLIRNGEIGLGFLVPDYIGKVFSVCLQNDIVVNFS